MAALPETKPAGISGMAGQTTTLSGEIGVAGDNSDNSYQVVTGRG